MTERLIHPEDYPTPHPPLVDFATERPTRTRYDPGKDFDWDLFLNSFSTFVAGGIVPLGNITARPLLIPDTEEFGPGIPDLFADE